jgi:GNAT superfamily N-acetyltransferase
MKRGSLFWSIAMWLPEAWKVPRAMAHALMPAWNWMNSTRIRESHWYVASVGVRAERESDGVGTRLLEPAISTSQATRVPLHLHTAEQRVIPFYQRLGFDEVDAIDLPDPPRLRSWIRMPR